MGRKWCSYFNYVLLLIIRSHEGLLNQKYNLPNNWCATRVACKIIKYIIQIALCICSSKILFKKRFYLSPYSCVPSFLFFGYFPIKVFQLSFHFYKPWEYRSKIQFSLIYELYTKIEIDFLPTLYTHTELYFWRKNCAKKHAYHI